MKRRPPKKIPKDQRWFWTPEWQAKEEEADKDLAAGRFERSLTSKTRFVG